jgi:hypothetical protein
VHGVRRTVPLELGILLAQLRPALRWLHMTDSDFARDPWSTIAHELVLIEAAALRAERHLPRSDARLGDARDAVVSVIEQLRNLMSIIRRASL